MQDRQFELLAQVVRSYVAEAEPVGSKALEQPLGVSSATIRNDMATLEQEGYLAQPYTSAGRVPTAKGYQLYVDKLMNVHEPKAPEQKSLREVMEGRTSDTEQSTKELAKCLAHFSGQAAVVGFGQDDVYYTGLANLFQQPEFREFNMVQAMGRVIDHLEEAFGRLYPEAQGEVQVRLGDSNPFGHDCAIVFASYPLMRQSILIGLLGPMRMDYDANVGRLNYVRRLTR